MGTSSVNRRQIDGDRAQPQPFTFGVKVYDQAARAAEQRGDGQKGANARSLGHGL